MRSRSFVRSLLIPSLALAAATGLALPAVGAEKSQDGLTLVVPSEHAALGTVYHVLKGKDGQITFTSDAPLEHIKGTSASVVGYAVLAPGETPALVAGEFHLPIASLDTGIRMRNEHLQGERWLNAAAHPDIVFVLKESRDVTLAKQTEDASTYDLTLVGDMTIKGVTQSMNIPARITLLPESQKTRMRAPGDLMGLRARYAVKLSDFGVADQAVGAKVADEIELDTALFFTTVAPSR